MGCVGMRRQVVMWGQAIGQCHRGCWVFLLIAGIRYVLIVYRFRFKCASLRVLIDDVLVECRCLTLKKWHITYFRRYCGGFFQAPKLDDRRTGIALRWLIERGGRSCR